MTISRITSLGKIAISARNGKIVALKIASTSFYDVDSKGDEKDVEVLELAFAQLEKYLGGSLFKFDIPLSSGGSEFQESVWEKLRKIPFGKTASYAEIAAEIGNSKAARAVGNACNKNPIPIFIPCHRVVSSDGKIGGFAYGTDLKNRLLKLEKSI